MPPVCPFPSTIAMAEAVLGCTLSLQRRVAAASTTRSAPGRR